MTTQEKFTAAMQALADERQGVELVIDRSYSNVGTYSFEFEGDFDPLLVIPFAFNGRRADFSSHGTNDVLGKNANGGSFSATEDGGYAAVIERVAELLNTFATIDRIPELLRRRAASAPWTDPAPVTASFEYLLGGGDIEQHEVPVAELVRFNPEWIRNLRLNGHELDEFGGEAPND